MSVAEEHMTILRQGVPAWNRFMRAHGYKVGAVFRGANLAAMDLTNLRISKYTRGRPSPLDWDNLHQYRLNLLRCHPITVSG